MFNPKGVLFWAQVMGFDICLALAFGPKQGMAAFAATALAVWIFA